MFSPSLALSGAGTDGVVARRRINATLRGPVTDALAAMVPELARLPRAQAFDIVLNDCDLLYRCFEAFQSHRRLFRFVLRDRRNRPVDGDNQMLACGRTLNQVVAMIVRSAAKRYFRVHLDPWQGRLAVARPQAAAAVPAGGWVGWLDRLLGVPLPEAMAPPKSAADRLYESIRAYLLHDWQVPIIPQYARMTPPEVRTLGAKILDFRSAAELARYLDVADEAPADLAEAEAEVVGTATLPGGEPGHRVSLSDVLTDDGSHLRMNAVVEVLTMPEIRALAGMPTGGALLDLCTRLQQTGFTTVRQLLLDFGLSPDQMIVLLAAAGRNLPGPVYERVFGPAADPYLVHRLIRMARAAGLTQASPLPAYDAFTDALFRPFRR